MKMEKILVKMEKVEIMEKILAILEKIIVTILSTAANSGTLLSAAVLMVRAIPRGGAAVFKFTRSPSGCGILDCPSLAWAASQWLGLRRSEGSPGPRLPSADEQLAGLQVTFVWYMSGIYMVYTWYIPGISCPTVNHGF